MGMPFLPSLAFTCSPRASGDAIVTKIRPSGKIPGLPRRAAVLVLPVPAGIRKANCMTDPVQVPEGPHVVDTVRFLRRFADLMSNGQNADWLLNAASLLETLSGRVIELDWARRSSGATDTGLIAQDHDRLEDECEALRNDIQGHLDLSRSLLGDRDNAGRDAAGAGCGTWRGQPGAFRRARSAFWPVVAGA